MFGIKCYRDWISVGNRRVPTIRFKEVERKLNGFDLGNSIFLKIGRHKGNRVDRMLAGETISAERRHPPSLFIDTSCV